jgi:NTE family protein
MKLNSLLLIVFLIGSATVSAQNKDSLLIENLVFEGAGIRGIAYCGALMELDERGYLSCIDKVAGTSSGAITACLVAIGYTPAETFEIIGSTDFEKFNDGKFGAVGGVSRLRRKLGYYKGQEFLQWLENLIEKKTGNKNLTFRDIQLARANQSSCTYKDLLIAATSLNHQRTILFSVADYPDMRIADAVHASMAIPLYFEPVIIDDAGHVVSFEDMQKEHHLCVDGGFTANFVISCFDVDGTSAPTLGLRMDSDEQIAEDKTDRELAYQHINSAGDFMGAFYYIIKETLNRQTLTEEDWRRTVSISDCGMSPKVKRLSKKEKQMMIDAGRKAVKDYVNGN